MQLRFAAYRILDALVPGPARARLAALPALAPLRRAVVGHPGQIAAGDVDFDGVRFVWAAPYPVLARAQRRGVENIICRAIRANTARGTVAIDVGANYGFLTMVMQEAVGGSGSVISIEAEASVASVLADTLATNEVTNVTQVVARAGAEHRPDEGKVSVDGLVAEGGGERVGVIKIDVDGPDYAVLRGARATLREQHPLVIIEMTKHQIEIYRLLVECGYTELVGMRDEPVGAEGPWPPNLFASVEPVAGL